MIKMTEVTDKLYYVDGEITDDDFFINLDSEHAEPADAKAGKEAAVYSVPVSLKQPVLDQLAKSSYILESGVIGTFECTRLIQLISMRFDAKRIEIDGEMAVTEESCGAANEAMREWRKGDMEPRISQVKKQLRSKLNWVIESNNQECLSAVYRKLRSSLPETDDVVRKKAAVSEIEKELSAVSKRLNDARSQLASATQDDFLKALARGDLDVGDLPTSALDALKSMAGGSSQG